MSPQISPLCRDGNSVALQPKSIVVADPTSGSVTAPSPVESVHLDSPSESDELPAIQHPAESSSSTLRPLPGPIPGALTSLQLPPIEPTRRGPPVRPNAISQRLGRRQRGPSEGDEGEASHGAALGDPDGSSTTTEPQRKRRRGISMLADADGQDSSNGTFRGATSMNGAQLQDGHAAAAGSFNGARRPAESTNSLARNGSSQNGSSSHNSKNLDALEQEARYLGHDREEVTRLLIQALSDMGYHTAAESVSRDSGCELESPIVNALRVAVLDGAWGRAEELLSGAASAGERQQAGNGLVLAKDADTNMMRIWLRQQKFLELLERRETARALMVLRSELTPLCQEQHSKLHFLSSLLMCQSPEDLKRKADWDGAYGQSRRILLSELSRACALWPRHW